MSRELIIALIVFSIVWIIVILKCIRKQTISIRYSLVWFLMALSLLIVGVFPKLMELISETFGFLTISNFIVGIMITLLMIVTLALTKIVTTQKNQIKVLTQEISMLKKEVNNGK